MRKARASLAILAAAVSAAACSDGGPTGDDGGLDFLDTGALDGGYTGEGGFASFGQALDPQFVYLYFNEALPEGPWDCVTDGHCGLGGLTDRFGNVVAADSFLFVSTANFRSDFDFDGDSVETVVINSGVQTVELTVANGSQFQALRMPFEWAFVTSRLDPAVHNDSIIIRLKAGTDSTTLVKVTAADLQAGRYPEKPGGCGEHAVITDRPITYSHCTDWQADTLDLTDVLGRTFVLQFIVGEGGQSLADLTDQPTALLFRRVLIEGGR